mgnify:CR=1 FL=1
MRRFSSLSDRLFLAMALLAVTSIGAATYYATAAVTAPLVCASLNDAAYPASTRYASGITRGAITPIEK